MASVCSVGTGGEVMDVDHEPRLLGGMDFADLGPAPRSIVHTLAGVNL